MGDESLKEEDMAERSEPQNPALTQAQNLDNATISMSAPDISKLKYNPANFAYWIGTGPWVAGYQVSYAISFYDDKTQTESARSKWWGPKTDPKKLYGGYGLINIPVDPTGQATARRIWRKFVGQPERMIYEIKDNVTTKYQDDAL
jgi:hypothetical protein